MAIRISILACVLATAACLPQVPIQRTLAGPAVQLVQVPLVAVQGAQRYSLADDLYKRELAYIVDQRSPPENYNFRYGVKDPLSGDEKDQEEVKTGDELVGKYSLLQPDGKRRTVQYSSRGLEGFLAVVTYS